MLLVFHLVAPPPPPHTKKEKEQMNYEYRFLLVSLTHTQKWVGLLSGLHLATPKSQAVLQLRGSNTATVKEGMRANGIAEV